jgi:hypothetical protein
MDKLKAAGASAKGKATAGGKKGLANFLKVSTQHVVMYRIPQEERQAQVTETPSVVHLPSSHRPYIM